MNKRIKNILTLGLAFTFVLASVLCCCIPDTAQATEIVPECHQTSQDADSSQNQNSENCCCPDIISITTEKANTNFELAKFIYGLIPISYEKYYSFTPEVIAYQAPPGMQKSSIPLYLQYSILRI